MNLTKRAILASSLSMLLCSSLLASEVYNIKSGSLKDAIKKISQISNMKYMGDTRILEGKKAPSLKNIEGLKNALKEVLKDTNLEAVIKNGTIIIKKKIGKYSSSNNLGQIDIIDSANITENTNSYTTSLMKTATKIDLSILDTPQSVSVITSKKMNDFSLNTINNVLLSAPGISVESFETDRSRYTSRGFDISNILVDGSSMPLSYGISAIGVDTALFNRIEIIKGATGLMSGAGDPSATINMIRKKPTSNLNASVDLTVGSWGKKRIVTDVSNSLNESKSIRGRIVAVAENSESFIDRYEKDKKLIYGILETDINDNTLFTFGASRFTENIDSPIWGLPLTYSDNTSTNYDVSINPSANWAFRNATQTEVFSKLQYNIDNNWDINANATYKKIDLEARSFYTWSAPDPSTNSVTTGSSHKKTTSKDKSIDLYIKGLYNLLDTEHQSVFGLSYAKRDNLENIKYGANPGPAYPLIPNLITWNGNTPLPLFNDRESSADFKEKQKAFYTASKINFNKNLFTLIGARLSSWEVEGEGYGKDKTSKNNNIFTPYLGLVYKFNENLSTYASYTTSFTPSGKIDINAKDLDPAEGKNYEFGIKKSFNENKVNASFALFKTIQDNVAESAGTLSDGRTYYSSEDGVKSKGFELEISGEVHDNLGLTFGYTRLNIEDKDGNETKPYIPKNQIKLSCNYKFTSIPKLQIGASLNWQDDIYRVQKTLSNGTKIKREENSYLIANLMANYKLNRNLDIKLNINNITNKKYISSLYSSEGVYGTPRSAYLSLKYKF